MGLAEVKLVLEMPDPALPGATREVAIARRLYRDSGSEYRINGREARLKDVQDLLLDTGMGTRAYSFIQQGQIDLILSSKPKDRRLLLEEAAGITRYKLRRTDAEKRLDETKANLQRLDDILFELSKQMDSLRRQALARAPGPGAGDPDQGHPAHPAGGQGRGAGGGQAAHPRPAGRRGAPGGRTHRPGLGEGVRGRGPAPGRR